MGNSPKQEYEPQSLQEELRRRLANRPSPNRLAQYAPSPPALSSRTTALKVPEAGLGLSPQSQTESSRSRSETREAPENLGYPLLPRNFRPSVPPTRCEPVPPASFPSTTKSMGCGNLPGDIPTEGLWKFCSNPLVLFFCSCVAEAFGTVFLPPLLQLWKQMGKVFKTILGAIFILFLVLATLSHYSFGARMERAGTLVSGCGCKLIPFLPCAQQACDPMAAILGFVPFYPVPEVVTPYEPPSWFMPLGSDREQSYFFPELINNKGDYMIVLVDAEHRINNSQFVNAERMTGLLLNWHNDIDAADQKTSKVESEISWYIARVGNQIRTFKRVLQRSRKFSKQSVWQRARLCLPFIGDEYHCQRRGKVVKEWTERFHQLQEKAQKLQKPMNIYAQRLAAANDTGGAVVYLALASAEDPSAYGHNPLMWVSDWFRKRDMKVKYGTIRELVQPPRGNVLTSIKQLDELQFRLKGLAEMLDVYGRQSWGLDFINQVVQDLESVIADLETLRKF